MSSWIGSTVANKKLKITSVCPYFGTPPVVRSCFSYVVMCPPTYSRLCPPEVGKHALLQDWLCIRVCMPCKCACFIVG